MRFKKVFFLPLFTLLSLTAYGQKVLVIDTLKGYDMSALNSDILQLCYNSIEDFDSANAFKITYNQTMFPNVVIAGLEVNQVCLLLDDKRGVMQINNIQSFPSDTIHISKWCVYKNGLTDTVKGDKVYYQMHNDSLITTTVKQVSFSESRKANGKKDLRSIGLRLNGNLIKVSVAMYPPHQLRILQDNCCR